MNHSLAGKSAVITGSTSGIGLGIARALAGRGANIYMNGVGEQQAIDDAVTTVKNAATGQVDFCPADLRNPDEIAALLNSALQAFGDVHILVNNAGIQYVSPVDQFPTDKWNDIIAINLSAAFHTIHAATPMMVAAGWGRIINIASAHAFIASPFKCAYVAAKHGLAGLTKTVALELAEKNVTVNAIAPGYVDTPLVRNQVAATARARGISEEDVIQNVMLAAQPTKQFVSIDQVASLALYLCSDDAASITGAILPIDGGWTAG